MFKTYPTINLLYNPRKTLSELIEQKIYPNPLLITGVLSLFYIFVDNFEQILLGYSQPNILWKPFLLTWLVMIVYVFVIGLIFQFFGARLGGKGTNVEIRSGILWASAPQLLGLLIAFLLYVAVYLNIQWRFSEFIVEKAFRIVMIGNILNSIGSIISALYQLLFISIIHKFSIFKGIILLFIGTMITLAFVLLISTIIVLL